MDWLDYLLKGLMVGGAVIIILWDGKRSRGEIKCVKDVITQLRLDLKDCVKWGDLDRELGPLRGEVKIHGEQIADMKARCSERHKAVA